MGFNPQHPGQSGSKKRPYSHLIVEPLEKVRTLRHLKTLVEQDEKEDLNALLENVSRLQQFIKAKIITTIKNKKSTYSGLDLVSLFDDKVLKHIMGFVHVSDLPNCRLVCKQWNVAASTQLKAKKIIKLTSFKYKRSEQELTATSLLRRMPRHSRLFPFTRFEITMGLYSTHLIEFLHTYAIFIKYMHLKYSELESYYSHGGSPLMLDFTRAFSFFSLQTCQHLAITNFPCDKLQEFPHDLPQHKNLTTLDIAILYSGTKANYFGLSSYYTKLMKSCSALESLSLAITYNCKLESGDIMQNIIESITSAELIKLQCLSLKWVDQQFKDTVIGNVDFTQLLPSVFKLKSLKLSNITCCTLLPFLKIHRLSLEEIRIHFSGKSEKIDFDVSQLSQARLLRLKLLALPGSLPQKQTKGMLKLIMEENFPILTKLIITEMGCKLYEYIPDFNTTVSSLKLKFNNSAEKHLPQNVLSVLDAFPTANKLSIAFAEQNILRNIWKTSLRSTLTEFSMCEPTNYCSKFPHTTDYIYELDSILTGYAASDCRAILVSVVNKTTFFDLKTFDAEKWKDLCKFATLHEHDICGSIACFKNLRKLKISFSKGHITEVSALYILGSLKQLTSLTIRSSSIRSYFVKNIRKSLDSAFLLDVECID